MSPPLGPRSRVLTTTSPSPLPPPSSLPSQPPPSPPILLLPEPESAVSWPELVQTVAPRILIALSVVATLCVIGLVATGVERYRMGRREKDDRAEPEYGGSAVVPSNSEMGRQSGRGASRATGSGSDHESLPDYTAAGADPVPPYPDSADEHTYLNNTYSSHSGRPYIRFANYGSGYSPEADAYTLSGSDFGDDTNSEAGRGPEFFREYYNAHSDVLYPDDEPDDEVADMRVQHWIEMWDRYQRARWERSSRQEEHRDQGEDESDNRRERAEGY